MSSTAHVSLINSSLTSLSEIPLHLRHEGVQSLNLHANSLTGLMVGAGFVNKMKEEQSGEKTVVAQAFDSRGRKHTVACFHCMKELNLSSNRLHLHQQEANSNKISSPMSISLLGLTPNLVQLDLSANFMAGLQELLRLAPPLQHLKVLNLSYNNLEALDGVPKSFPNVEELNVKGNKIALLERLLVLGGCRRLAELTMQIGKPKRDEMQESNPVCLKEGYVAAGACVAHTDRQTCRQADTDDFSSVF